MTAVTLFTWGYWGWGSSTAELVKAVDAVELDRGFEPPLFVDIRWKRSVRATGFRDRNFEQRVGSVRYKWMRSLGNRAIGASDGPAIVISEPAAAKNLLDVAADAATRRQRVIFFCACERPREGGKTWCHRDEVGRLVQEEAERRGLTVEVVEWPGGSPVRIDVPVTIKTLRDVLRGRTTIPLDDVLPLHRAAGLPHCSIAILKAPEQAVPAIVGPAVYRSGWFLPIQGLRVKRDDQVEDLEREAMRLRREWGYDERTTGCR